MTPQGHPPESIRARDGFCIVWYDDATQQTVRLDQFALVKDAAEAAKRAVRMLMPDAQAESVPLSVTVTGLFGEQHCVDLLHVQQVSAWPASAVAAQTDDARHYATEEREPWQG